MDKIRAGGYGRVFSIWTKSALAAMVAALAAMPKNHPQRRQKGLDMSDDNAAVIAYGATPAEWERASLAIRSRLLPCVCDPGATPVKGSKIAAESAAKIPSMMRSKRTYSGITGWTRRPPATEKDIASWSARPEHGILCRTGALQDASGQTDVVYAIDADVEDAAEADLILRIVMDTLGVQFLSVRSRGSARWACLIREAGQTASPKRVIPMASGCVEVLGSGGQLAIAGTHPKGTRYAWSRRASVARDDAIDGALEVMGPREGYPAGTVDRIVDALSMLATGAPAASADKPARTLGESYEAADSLADWLMTSGAVEIIAAHPDGRIDLKCPWAAEHTGGGDADKPQDATYFRAGSYGYAHGGFRCLHAHSGGGGHERSTAELRAWARDHGWRGELEDGELPDLSADAETVAAAPPPAGLLGRAELDERLTAAGWRGDSGKIEPTVDSISLALLCPDLVGVEIRKDCFMAAIQTRAPGGDWMPVSNALITDIRRRLECYGFKARGLGFDLLDRCVELVAEQRRMDSMREHLESYAPAWDGVERWRELLRVRCLATDSADYLAALGEYIGATLWARATCAESDGVKADIVPVLVGIQGTRKSTLVGVLAMDERWRADLDLAQDDVEIIRKMRGHVTAEIPELVGLGKRAETAVKAFLSQAYDDVRPLYRSHVERYPRRCLIMMTTNNLTFLSDPTGNRRFAPIHVGGTIDIDAIREDLPQLWAEGRELAAAKTPIERMRDVERLAADAVESATVMTAEDDVIALHVARLRDAERMQGYTRPPLTMAVIQSQWLGWQKAPGRGGTARELGARLQRAGMVSVRRMVPAPGGGLMRVSVWEIAGCAPVEYTLPPEDLAAENPFSDAGK